MTTIEVHDLWKEFLLSHSGANSLKTAFLWWQKRQIEPLQVLRGVSFTVSQGECVAIVGRNGAGKSTLLSLLARVYKPTRGEAKVNGRVAPLLELGAGFHPDLTGLENVLFNGVILGLTRAQVAARMDQIVAFAELEDHIDAPVRSYSSGMLARLGFSVAIHVDADVLVVDEVLSVGDFAFEQKCFAHMESFKSKGGTILFVSHDRSDIERIADRCLWLDKGVIRMDDGVQTVMDSYERPD